MLGIPITAKALGIVLAVSASAVLALSGGWWLHVTSLRSDLREEQGKSTSLDAQLSTALRERSAAVASATQWEATALGLHVRLADLFEQLRVNDAQHKAAVAQAQNSARLAAETYARWRERYDAANSREECRRLRETKLCVY